MRTSLLQPATEADKKHERELAIRRDRNKIDEILALHDLEALRSQHMYIDGKYGAYVPDWSKSMYGYVLNFGFDYECLDETSLVSNLKLMQAKLDGFALDFSRPRESIYMPSSNVNVSVKNTNEMNVSLSFDEIREQIKNMTSLTDEQTQETLNRLSEIESVIKGEGNKKTKWEKIKPILVWLADKSFDVGMALLPLILQIA